MEQKPNDNATPNYQRIALDDVEVVARINQTENAIEVKLFIDGEARLVFTFERIPRSNDIFLRICRSGIAKTDSIRVQLVWFDWGKAPDIVASWVRTLNAEMVVAMCVLDWRECVKQIVDACKTFKSLRLCKE